MTRTMLADLLLFGLRPPRMHLCVHNRGLPASTVAAGLTSGCWSRAGIRHCCAGVVLVTMVTSCNLSMGCLMVMGSTAL